MMPIESAPKDGTPVKASTKSEWVKAFDYFPYVGTMRFLEGAWAMKFGKDDWHPVDPQPTHWMPAPLGGEE